MTEFLSTLEGTLSPDLSTRKEAERAVEIGSKQPGFAVALTQVASSVDIPPHLRQLAAVLLKKQVKEHWSFESVHFKEPPVDEVEKAQVRALLPQGLAAPDSKVRTACAMAISTIARWDCPEQWPELLPGILAAIADKTNIYLMNGAIQCLAMFVDELGDDHILSFTPILLPELFILIKQESTGYSPSLQIQSLKILKTILESLEMVSSLGERRKEATTFLTQTIGPWMAEIARIVSLPATVADYWGVKHACLTVLVQLTASFSKVCGPYMPAVLHAAWSMLSESLGEYTSRIVYAEGGDGDVNDEDRDPNPSLEDAIAQLMEFVVTVSGNRKYSSFMKGGLDNLAYVALGYSQLTNSAMVKWQENGGEFLAEEDDDFWTVRASVEILLEAIIDVYGQQGFDAFKYGVQRRLSEASSARSAGDGNWWRLREGTLFVASSVGASCDSIAGVSELMKGLVQSMLQEDLSGDASIPPFLSGRALWTTAKLSTYISPAHRPGLLQIAVGALAPQGPAALSICACGAISKLACTVEPSCIMRLAPQIYSGCSELLAVADENTLHIILETLYAVIKADPMTAAHYGEVLAAPMLSIWLEYIADPLISEDVKQVLQALTDIPSCLATLQSKALPTLCQIISHSTSGGVEWCGKVMGALELLTLLVTPCTPQGAESIDNAIHSTVVNAILSTEEDAVMEAGSSYLMTVLQVGGVAALTWGGKDVRQSVASILAVVVKLLDPGVGDFASIQVGGLLMELLRHAGPHIASQLPMILKALAQKLLVAEYPSTVQTLVCVLAHLTLTNAEELIHCLASIQLAEGFSALQAVMDVWTQRQMEMRTPYDIKLTTTALTRILMTPPPSAIDDIYVRGRRLDTNGKAIRTRSKSCQQKEEWSVVPLRVKVAVLLVDSYIEQVVQHGGKGSIEKEEEWDEIEDDTDDDSDSENEDLENIPYAEGQQENAFALQCSKRVGGLLKEYDEESLEVVSDLSNVNVLEAKRRKTDPLNSIDLEKSTREVFRVLASSGPELLQAALAELSQTQADAMRSLCESS